MVPGLFQWVAHFEGTEGLCVILPPNLISNHFQALVVQGEGAASNQKTEARKTLRLMPSQGEIDGSIVVEYTEIVEGSQVRFVW